MFGWLPEAKSPFLDERVRQAVSLSVDRDLWLDTVFNVTPFTSQGLPVETREKQADLTGKRMLEKAIEQRLNAVAHRNGMRLEHSIASSNLPA